MGALVARIARHLAHQMHAKPAHITRLQRGFGVRRGTGERVIFRPVILDAQAEFARRGCHPQFEEAGAGGMHGDIFYPTAFLRALIGTGPGMSFGFAAHLFLAGIVTFRFLRAWGLGFFPSLIGGVAYMLSGPVAGLASPGHDGKLFVSSLFPLTLLMLTRGIRDGRAWRKP